MMQSASTPNLGELTEKSSLMHNRSRSLHKRRNTYGDMQGEAERQQTLEDISDHIGALISSNPPLALPGTMSNVNLVKMVREYEKEVESKGDKEMLAHLREKHHFHLQTEFNSVLAAAVLTATLSAFQVGFNTGVINVPAPMIRANLVPGDEVSNLQWSFIVSIFAIGGLFGSYISGPLANSYGRQHFVMGTNVLFVLGGLLELTAFSVWMMVFGRFLIGVCSGGLTVIIPLYLGEISPAAMRGSVGVLYQLALVVGLMAGTVLAKPLGGPVSWRLLLGVTVAIALLQGLLIMMGLLTETPSWLHSKGDDDRASEIQSRLSMVNLQSFARSRSMSEFSEHSDEGHYGGTDGSSMRRRRSTTSKHNHSNPSLSSLHRSTGHSGSNTMDAVDNLASHSLEDQSYLNGTGTGTGTGTGNGNGFDGQHTPEKNNNSNTLDDNDKRRKLRTTHKNNSNNLNTNNNDHDNHSNTTTHHPYYMSDHTSNSENDLDDLDSHVEHDHYQPCTTHASSSMNSMDSISVVYDSELEELEDCEDISISSLFDHPRLAMPLAIAISLHLAQQFSGINAVFYYSSDFFAGANIKDTYMGSVLITGVNVIGTLIAVKIMDYDFERRHVLGFSTLGMMLSGIGLTFMLIIKEQQDNDPYPGIDDADREATNTLYGQLSVFFMLAYVIFFEMGLGPIPWIRVAEIFPKKYTFTAMSLACTINWVCNFIVGATFPSVNAYLGSYTFVPFVIVLLITTLVSFFAPAGDSAFDQKNQRIKENSHRLHKKLASVSFANLSHLGNESEVQYSDEEWPASEQDGGASTTMHNNNSYPHRNNNHLNSHSLNNHYHHHDNESSYDQPLGMGLTPTPNEHSSYLYGDADRYD